MPVCTVCGIEKNNSEFYKRTTGRLRRDCKKCTIRRNQWNSKQRLYGITKKHYLKLLKDQDNSCALCKRKCPSGASLAVDHCHKTGQIRGLLCIVCNTQIGTIEKHWDNLDNIVKYINGA